MRFLELSIDALFHGVRGPVFADPDDVTFAFLTAPVSVLNWQIG
jgi:hypothetical protein